MWTLQWEGGLPNAHIATEALFSKGGQKCPKICPHGL